MYKILIKPILFLFSPETSHNIVSFVLRMLFVVPGIKFLIKKIYVIKDERLKRELFGLTFNNPVGLAAGFDKNASLFDCLSNFGFGFIEIGTVTPLAQEGNPKPRIFRLPVDKALVNRMGFNNDGVEAIAYRLRNKNSECIIGGNIGKNKITPLENAIDDYEKGFLELFDYVDYFAVNVSSPNTPNLRQLQEKEHLVKILTRLQDLNSQKENPAPVLLKISPDVTFQQLDEIIDVVISTKIHGVIAVNTTLNRNGLTTPNTTIQSFGEGGLSGQPLKDRSTEIIKYLSEKSNKSFSIIGVGGISSAADAIEKLNAGADLIQIYTGFIYEGPSLIKEINLRIINDQQVS